MNNSNLHLHRVSFYTFYFFSPANGDNQILEDNTLRIKPISKEHEGVYVCRAENGVGGVEAVMNLTVQVRGGEGRGRGSRREIEE